MEDAIVEEVEQVKETTNELTEIDFGPAYDADDIYSTSIVLIDCALENSVGQADDNAVSKVTSLN